MKTKYKYLFGPVPSRRLGRSLGVDVTPFKTCSFDCIFCQCGCTTRHVTEREEFVPLEAVCNELMQWLAEDGCADYITLAGSGEPTLYGRLGELIEFIKEKTEIPVILLSNGTLLRRQDVREEAAGADIVKVSLSAWDDKSFRQINRPAPGLSFETVLRGEKMFRRHFTGQLWLEVFLMEGINADARQVKRIADIAEALAPDRIHLNTAVRPPAEAEVRPVGENKLRVFCGYFSPVAEMIASFEAAPVATEVPPGTDSLVCLIHRHPATAEQLAAVSGASAQAVEAILEPLVEEGTLQTEARNGETWYK